MIVVSDTSPLNYLILIGCDEVLPKLFTRVVLPSAVVDELHHPRAPSTVRQWAECVPAWVTLGAPAGGIPRLPGLDAGESEAIVLAEELRQQNSEVRLLIDEREGRHHAARRGLNVIGLLALLVMADERSLVDLADAFRRLGSTSFYADPALMNTLLQRARGRGSC